jgi:hypothetical protein
MFEPGLIKARRQSRNLGNRILIDHPLGFVPNNASKAVTFIQRVVPDVSVYKKLFN